MRNLAAEMARNGVSAAAIQKVIGCSPRTVTNKMSGTTEFTVGEAMEIRNQLFPGLQLEYLFQPDVPSAHTMIRKPPEP